MAVPYIRIFGDKEAILRLKKGEHTTRDMRKPLRKISEDIMRVIGATFSSQGRRYGGSWARLDPDTVREKARHNQGSRILIASERLKNSWTKLRSRNQNLMIDGSSITLESKLPYAEVHQKGDDSMGIPARPYIAFDQRDVQNWARICERELLRAMGF